MNSAVGVVPLLVLLSMGALSGLFLSRLFRTTHARRGGDARLSLGFPLLGMTLTALFLTVQFSLPISLGLLAALSLVRFRTPVKHPGETAFLFAVVATSVSLGAFKIAFAGAFLAAVTLLSVAGRFVDARRRPGVHGVVEISMPRDVPEDSVSIVQHAAGRRRCTLERVSMETRGARLAYRFSNLSETALDELRRELQHGTPAARIRVWTDLESPR